MEERIEKEITSRRMIGFGIHIGDSIINLCGRVREVQTISQCRILGNNIDDTTVMLRRFQDGMLGYFATMLATSPVDSLRIRRLG
jgi:hypothetical protein